MIATATRRIFVLLVSTCIIGTEFVGADEPNRDENNIITTTYLPADAAAGESAKQATGRVVVSDKQGGVLLESENGRFTIIPASQIRSVRSQNRPFKPLTHKELGEQLLEELPDGFSIHTTPHYVVAYNTSSTYARWTSSLFERLHRAFTNYWRTKGLELSEPSYPLPVVVYASVDDYRRAARPELGKATGSVIGYYSLVSNRVNTYDLTGTQQNLAAANARTSLRTINRMLNTPNATPLVATIVHEATHQLAYNCGLHQRLADIPLWLVEGMAVYFEAPDLQSSRGWSGIGKVNHLRLARFQSHLPTWQHTYFRQLVLSDQVFRQPNSALDAYADAWALNYYLIQYRSDDYAAYLKVQAAKSPLARQSQESRLKEFEQHFGPLQSVERDFLKRMNRIN